MRDAKGRFLKGNKVNVGRKRPDTSELNRLSVGRKSPLKGIPRTAAVKEKMRKAALARFADKTKHPRWKGGITTYERKLFLNNKRRALKFTNGGSHTFEEWENLKLWHGNSCVSCSRSEPDVRLTRDHIVPLSKGGNDSIENIQPLCRSCNSIKSAKEVRYV